MAIIVLCAVKLGSGRLVRHLTTVFCAVKTGSGRLVRYLTSDGLIAIRRRYLVGEAMAMGDPSAQKYWTLPEIIERMQNAYCKTLTAEFDHLPLR